MRTPREPGQAFTAIELVMIVFSLAILGVILFPALTRRRAPPSRINCVNNLKQIGCGFRTWAADNNERFPMQVPLTNGGTMELVDSGVVFPHFLVMSNELCTPQVLNCPADRGRREANTFQRLNPPTFSRAIPLTNDNSVSYFVGVDADETRPQMFLCGDSDLAFDGVPAKPGLNLIWSNNSAAWVKPRHDGGGNICCADGSVQRLTTPELSSAFLKSGVVTNRLAVP